ncbi:MAG: hypothetical protein WCQ94_03020 [Lachnospiraceae bacterium]|nr:hypothetical protein [Lachnospiraceae bacterium]
MRKRIASFVLTAVCVMCCMFSSLSAAQAGDVTTDQAVANQISATTGTIILSGLPASKASDVKSTWSGNRCSNIWSNVNFSCPTGWYRLTGDQVTAITNEGMSALTNGSVTDGTTVNSVDVLYTDYYALNGTGTALFYSQIMDCNAAGALNMTAEEYLGQVKAVLATVSSMNVSCGDITDRKVAGNDAKEMSIAVSDLSGVHSIHEDMTIEKIGQFMFIYVSAYSTDDAAKEVEGLWNQIG